MRYQTVCYFGVNGIFLDVLEKSFELVLEFGKVLCFVKIKKKDLGRIYKENEAF